MTAGYAERVHVKKLANTLFKTLSDTRIIRDIMKKDDYIFGKEVSLQGCAFINESVNLFSFAPDDPVPGLVPRFRSYGTAQQMTDGTFDFVPHPRIRANSKLIKKLAHGRASETRDGAIQLTLKVFKTEGVNINETILSEAVEAAKAIREYQLKR